MNVKLTDKQLRKAVAAGSAAGLPCNGPVARLRKDVFVENLDDLGPDADADEYTGGGDDDDAVPLRGGGDDVDDGDDTTTALGDTRLVFQHDTRNKCVGDDGRAAAGGRAGCRGFHRKPLASRWPCVPCRLLCSSEQELQAVAAPGNTHAQIQDGAPDELR